MRPFLIAGNWKMNQTVAETASYFSELSSKLSEAPRGVHLLLCPTYTSLFEAVKGAEKIKGLAIGAQNMHYEDGGAFTGEITADMVKDTGASYVILGHSERREYYNETDETVNKKTHKALEAGLTPVVCVGEVLDERKADTHFDVVKKQVHAAVEGISAGHADKLVIAYEPVWAIGTGETASPEQAQEMHAFIRKELSQAFSSEVADKILILYGGSMKPANAEELLSCDDVDGGLIGGASLKPDSYFQIIEAAGKLQTI